MKVYIYIAHGNGEGEVSNLFPARVRCKQPFNIADPMKCTAKSVFISLGANLKSRWGAPAATLCRCMFELEKRGFLIIRRSRIYRTSPHFGAGLMPEFYNAVIEAQSAFSVGVLLRTFRDIERDAGRRSKQRWSARPLDIDLLACGGRILNWPQQTRRGGPIVLPHPLLHERGFVLVPLVEIKPHWRHPVLGRSAATLLAAQPRLRRGIVPA